MTAAGRWTEGQRQSWGRIPKLAAADLKISLEFFSTNFERNHCALDKLLVTFSRPRIRPAGRRLFGMKARHVDVPPILGSSFKIMCAEPAKFARSGQSRAIASVLRNENGFWAISGVTSSEVQEAVMNRIWKSEKMLRNWLLLLLCIVVPAFAWGQNQKKTNSPAPAPKSTPAQHSAPAQHAPAQHAPAQHSSAPSHSAAPSHSNAPSHSTAPSHTNTTPGPGRTTAAAHGNTTANHGN